MSDEIPRIDLEPWFEGGAAGQTAVVDAVRGACEGIGFFVLSGHRVEPVLVRAIYDASRAFFDEPEGFKQGFPPTGPVMGGFEYFAMESEKLAATRGEVTPGDLKETIDFGPGYGGVAWPQRPAGLEAAWQAYYVALDGLCTQLRAVLAQAAGLPRDYFEPRFVDHLSSLRAINYPEPSRAPQPGQLRAGAHSDYGFLTVLLSEDRPGGLEVQNLGGQWVAPPALPGTFIVNLGDSLMRWTDDRWQSTPHRVVNPPAGSGSGSRRQAIAFFHNPARHALIDTLPTFRKPGRADKYPPITYGDYAVERQSKSHAAFTVEMA